MIPTASAIVFDPQERMDFLRRDLVHLFDETGIDKSSYEEVVEFIDPITSYRRLSGGCPANQRCQTHQSSCRELPSLVGQLAAYKGFLRSMICAPAWHSVDHEPIDHAQGTCSTSSSCGASSTRPSRCMTCGRRVQTTSPLGGRCAWSLRSPGALQHAALPSWHELSRSSLRRS